MCRYGLLDAIVSNNGTQFASTVVIEFCKDLGIQTKFVYVVHPQDNRQAESVNKIILKGLKKKLDMSKVCGWKCYEILWSYHTTP